MQRLMQLALDFLGGPDPLPPPTREVVAVTPPVLRPRLDPAAPPAEPLNQVFQPGTWHHPRANRLLVLGSCEVAYEFKRGKRRTIGLSVGPDGLSVSAPRWTPVGEVDALLHTKSAWVLEKLQRARERAGELAQARTVWANGAELDFLGQRVRLVLDPAHGFTQVGAVLETVSAEQPAALATLRLGLAHSASEAQIRDAAQAWLMRQAKRLFTERLDHFAPLLGVRYEKLRLSSAGTRWGSASADGTIRLNWRLIHLKLEMVDYVVVHELSHLRHMDHSPQFWNVVASILPDHQQRRQALKRSAVPLGE
ncbi:MAG: M48 family metallopeptidase [Hydrogenophaga sp.]|uniref:M48 family metallopeptidase n=1 Tax=Hydrogenophaga sp. TaxID=1904254 RepID=UPI001BC445CD|nr:SprT family zinc-dependent metalloprotease [Hydrogenophaga sp.]MBS3911145.1 M48 family metallopeptidase [Hydrogenophaga sp.]MDO9507433.1 SprT family zinc-dependent metalloprotease [Hydrogenophaga sp.]MDP2162804.1 SprT family zinc-dependent metalloprotease [Hydrogenophaga sp.]MDP3475175.1 SprT family zinc-dependent metalloprotease [Hydrogenophaga sp.]